MLSGMLAQIEVQLGKNVTPVTHGGHSNNMELSQHMALLFCGLFVSRLRPTNFLFRLSAVLPHWC